MKPTTKAELTTEQIAWLREAHAKRMHPRLMAVHLGFHVDTVRRLLDRHRILPAASAKFMALEAEARWERPCMKCKCTKSRPKFQYICTRCKSVAEVTGVHDDFLIY